MTFNQLGTVTAQENPFSQILFCRTLNTEISELEASVYVNRYMSTACRCNAGISLPYAADTSSDVLM